MWKGEGKKNSRGKNTTCESSHMSVKKIYIYIFHVSDNHVISSCGLFVRDLILNSGHWLTSGLYFQLHQCVWSEIRQRIVCFMPKIIFIGWFTPKIIFIGWFMPKISLFSLKKTAILHNWKTWNRQYKLQTGDSRNI